MELKINLTNCYGIKKLEHNFDFTNKKSACIYASNGTMKTSFAKTFIQIQNDEQPKDEIFNKVSKYNIQMDNIDINKDNIFVIKSFQSTYKSESVSKLLVSEQYKEQYDKIIKTILKNKNDIITKISKSSGIKKDNLEDIIFKDFNKNTKDIYSFFKNIKFDKINEREQKIKYSELFNPKVEVFLKEKSIKDSLSEYSNTYNKLLEETPFYGTNSFNPAGADTVLKALDKNKFFTQENNKIKLNNIDNLLDKKSLQEEIENSKKKLLENETLKNLSKKITANEDLKKFNLILENNSDIIHELNQPEELKKNIWNSYFKELQKDIENLLENYNDKLEEIKKIEKQATIEQTKWYEVVKIFEDRFNVPFKVAVENSTSVVLGQQTPHLVFNFTNQEIKNKSLNRDTLDTIDVLSQGERRALYLLNIIFEIEQRAKDNITTIFIIDDTADSFDYQNKYAILEYLKELPQKAQDRFYQIILTHNFDFFRTVQKGLQIKNNSFIANKKEEGISLEKAGDDAIISPFKQWQGFLKDSSKPNKELYFITLIPFIREILDYTGKKKNANKEYTDEYKTLSNVLHWKNEETDKIKFKDLADIFNEVIDIKIFEKKDDSIFNSILDIANNIIIDNKNDSIKLENRVLLSIACRLQAERFLESQKIKLDTQIGKSFQQYKNTYKDSKDKKEYIKLLEKIVIMTPENIHLNSFMYEPLLDMNDEKLKGIFQQISKLVTYEININKKENIKILEEV